MKYKRGGIVLVFSQYIFQIELIRFNTNEKYIHKFKTNDTIKF
jgi:hypothetical protein